MSVEIGFNVVTSEFIKAAPGSFSDAMKVFDQTISQMEEGAAGDGLKIINAADLLNSEPPPVDPVLFGLFDTGDKLCIIAPSKAKKTFFLAQMAAAIASGVKFLHWEVQRPRRVLLVQLEVKPEHFHRRLKLVSQGMGNPPVYDRLGVVNGRGFNVTFDELKKFIEEQRAEVVCIDPVYKLMHEGDENGAEAWREILREFDQLAKETGAAVVYVHHDAKGHAGERNAVDRGSGSGIVGRDYDTAITITHHRQLGDLRVIETIKRNYPTEAPFSVEWIDGAFQLSDEAAEVLTSRNSNKKETSYLSTESFLHRVPDCLIRTGKAVLNKGRMIDAVRVGTALTKARATDLVEMAVEEGILKTGGEGLRRKVILFALEQGDLDAEIDRRKAEDSGKQENLCLSEPKNKDRKTTRNNQK